MFLTHLKLKIMALSGPTTFTSSIFTLLIFSFLNSPNTVQQKWISLVSPTQSKMRKLEAVLLYLLITNSRHFLLEKKSKASNPCSPASQAATIFRVQLFLLTKANHISVCRLLKSFLERGMRRVLRSSLKYPASPPKWLCSV